MRILTEKINLDLNQNGIQATIDLREGDIESRLIIATLRGYGDAFRPDDNVIAVIRAKKPDGTIIYNNCLVEDGKVKFLVTSQYAAVVGNYNACIEIIKDGVVLYSPKFSFHVAANELSDSEVESASEYTELTTALEQALTALELAQNLHLLKFVENLEDEGDEKYLYVLTSDYHYIPYVWDAENERYMELESNLEELAEFGYLLNIQKERVDNLLAEAVPGSTTRDLEVIDGRTGYDGRTYANLGTAIREQVYDLHSENTNLQNSMEAADDNLDNIKANKSDVNTTTANIEAEIAVERARIDNIVALPEGSTQGDAELADIRVGADGTTYNNAGDAVRGQVNKLKNNIDEYIGVKPFPNSENLLDLSGLSSKGTYWVNGVEYHDSGTTGNTPKMVSLKMLCEENTVYYNSLYKILDDTRINNTCITYLNYFKKDGTFISYESGSTVTYDGRKQGKFTTPQNAAYIMITYVAYTNATDIVPSQKCLVSRSSVPDKYIDYTLYNLHTAKEKIDILNNVAGYKKTITGISSYREDGGAVGSSGNWGGGADSTSLKHIVVPCDADFTFFKVKAVSNKYFYFTAVTDYVRHSSNGDPIQNKTSYWLKTIYVGQGETVSGLVPKDAKFLLITSYDGSATIDTLEITSIKNPEVTIKQPNKITMSAFNVRDFSDGTNDGGCPSSLVSTNIPLWKDLISKWLNTDFINITEWRTKFDENNEIDTYDTLFKQFYPFKYEVIYDDVAIQCLMSKHECIFTDLYYYGDVNRLIPMLITVINGKSIAVVGWLQSATDTVANREKAYRNAATILSTFDYVILGGDFNTEVGLEELEELTERGYVLGNGGYWGIINTWPSILPATPNDNIVTKGLILKLFEVSNNPITSDHLPIKANLEF